MPVISLYPTIRETFNSKDIDTDLFLENIKIGHWQDSVLPIRCIVDDKERQTAKQRLPYVTLSGKFHERKISALISHSGFIGMDIDDITDIEAIKKILASDPFVYSVFVSASGRGLCVMFKINGHKHLESFLGIQEYLYNNYKIIIDPSGKDVSRPRYVSFDPFIYINQNSKKFTSYPSKKSIVKRPPEVVFAQSDFDAIINSINESSVDITGSYNQWLQIGFSLADKFGEDGRSYYHSVSSHSLSYSPELCDRQYTNCLKAGRSGITIATFYYLCKQAGISIMSDRTREISKAAASNKKAGLTKERSIENIIQSFPDDAGFIPEIVNQIFDSNIIVEDVSELEALKIHIKENYHLRRNALSRYIENGSIPMQRKDFNSIYLDVKSVFPKINYQDVERIIDSNLTTEYNPIIDFIEANKDRSPKGEIEKLFSTIETDTGMREGDFFPDYAYHYGKKWLVGIISSIYGQHSPLMLMLCGKKQGTGKTEWLRRLLPVQLLKFFADSKLDKGKDDEILLTQKLLILIDEMAGNAVKDGSTLKYFLSKQTFYLREPYGKGNIELNRLATLCGTTNDISVLNDPTGNRRIIPINVLSIDHNAYNKIDKTDLFIEAYHLYKSGFDWSISGNDIKRLNENTTVFENHSAEQEIVMQYYRMPNENNETHSKWLTSTQIKTRAEIITGQKLSDQKIGAALGRLQFIQKQVRVEGYPTPRKCWKVIEVNADGSFNNVVGCSML